MQRITVSIEAPSGPPDQPLPFPYAPMYVGMEIPHQLIHMARTYPTLDWNKVMRLAIEAADQIIEEQR